MKDLNDIFSEEPNDPYLYSLDGKIWFEAPENGLGTNYRRLKPTKDNPYPKTEKMPDAEWKNKGDKK